MSHSATVEHVNIVLLGSFNPAIYQPSWFAAHGLIPSADDKTPLGTTLNVSHREVTDFKTDEFQLQVVQQRFSIRVNTASFYDGARDLVVGTFKILRHTPITKMGINSEFHFKMPDAKQWNAVGDRLAPKASWGALTKPGMISCTMQGSRTDERTGYLRVRVEPSSVVPSGVFVEVNDHFEASAAGGQGCDELIEVLGDVWEESLQGAETIATSLLDSA